MKLQLVGCSHHASSVAVRERLAFTPAQIDQALERWREQFPRIEAVILSTCNRTELYAASEEAAPSHHDIAEFIAAFHRVPLSEVFSELFEQSDEGAVRHLFTVAASLDSMVVGEVQILSQVKQAYQRACQGRSAGPITHEIFQAALRVAKRVATETTIHQRRTSVASVAIGEFASQIFERFDDKEILVIGGGETAEEALRHLFDQQARRITVVNRSPEPARSLAAQFGGRATAWESLDAALVEADLVISATGASEPIVTLERYRKIEAHRYQRPLFVLDLAVPRDFDPAIGQCLAVYLYSIDDLREACEANRRARERQWPAAERIIDEETCRFMRHLYHRVTVPTIQQVLATCEAHKRQELERLFGKVELDERTRLEVVRAFDRFVNKVLHLPLESLRTESVDGAPHGLLDALKKLFQLKD